MRDIITLECTDCKRRNYSTTKNKKKQTGRVEYRKFCRFVQQAHARTKRPGNRTGCSGRGDACSARASRVRIRQ